MILDIHTHKQPPALEAIIACDPRELPVEGAFPHQRYSTGIHPWSITAAGLTAELKELLEKAAGRNDVVAIGECGIDLARDGAAPLFAQLLAFKAHVELSERLGKPLIIHCVKAFNEIIGIKKELKPIQPWIIHGFRGKPSVLQMLQKAEFRVSYGEKFNPESVALTPADQLLAETDASSLPIEKVISDIAAAIKEPCDIQVLKKQISANISRLIHSSQNFAQDKKP